VAAAQVVGQADGAVQKVAVVALAVKVILEVLVQLVQLLVAVAEQEVLEVLVAQEVVQQFGFMEL
jgi:hypothetical protein